ncbi:MAG: hypothetical protein Q8K85_00010 [Hyphomicrobium sp.]|nr:hypothetical protein [Hyphomicrobium sp.]
MRIDVILAERSRVRADLVFLGKAIKAVEARRVRDGNSSGDNDVLAKCLTEYQRLSERLTFIDETVIQVQCRKTG